MTRCISLAGEQFSQSAIEEIGIMDNDAARSDAFSRYCISSKMSIDEVSFHAPVFAAGWNAGCEYANARAEAAEAEVARLRALIETLYVRVNYGEHGEIDNPTPVMCVGVHPIRWGKMAAPTMGFYPFRLPATE